MYVLIASNSFNHIYNPLPREILNLSHQVLVLLSETLFRIAAMKRVDIATKCAV